MWEFELINQKHTFFNCFLISGVNRDMWGVSFILLDKLFVFLNELLFLGNKEIKGKGLKWNL